MTFGWSPPAEKRSNKFFRDGAVARVENVLTVRPRRTPLAEDESDARAILSMRKCSTSRLTHGDFAASGERMTRRLRDWSSAAAIFLPQCVGHREVGAVVPHEERARPKQRPTEVLDGRPQLSNRLRVGRMAVGQKRVVNPRVPVLVDRHGAISPAAT